MQMYIIDESDNYITIGIKNANSTILTPIIDCLNMDETVELVRFIETHPELDDRRLYVSVNDGNPRDAIIRAAESVKDYFSGEDTDNRGEPDYPVLQK